MSILTPMISRIRRLGVVLSIGLLATCSPVTGSDNDNNLEFLEKSTENFVFVYTRSDSPTIDALAASMEAQLARLMTKLQVDSLPTITVVLYPSRATFQEANNTDFWVPAVSRRTRIEMISPNAPNQVFELWPDTRAEHMLTHIVSYGVNDDSGNNPRWLWESLALYESGQKTAASAIEFFKPGAQPALSQLNGGYRTPIFDVGYYLGEFLETRWGVQGIIDLIEEEGDLPAVLGLTGQQFIDQFVAFVRQKYGLPSQ
jgi:hypothetical protein